MHLDYVVLPVDDVAGVRDWYRDRLGLAAVWDTEAFCLLAGDDGARLGFHRGAPLESPGAVQLHLVVDDVDATFLELRDDVAFDGEPADTEWGHRTVACADPAGHTVELFTPGGR